MAINISNPKGRDAVVAFEAVMPKREVYFVDAKGKPTGTQKLLKTDTEHDLAALLKKKKTLAALGKALVKDDPEINLEEFGMYLVDTSRVYVSKKGIIHLVEEFEVITNPDGTLRERRPRKKDPQNINTDIPLRWSGKFIRKEEAAHKFIFTHKRQLIHVNGLTFDFLYEMAKELDERNSLLLIRGGEKGDKPIVMQRGGKPYNAFLEGRIKGDTYLLVLQLSNMELKRPAVLESSSKSNGAKADEPTKKSGKEMKLGFDKERLAKKKGDYATIDAIHLADPSLHARVQDYKRLLSGKMRAVSAQDIGRINAGRGYIATRKYDGEMAVVFFDGERLMSINPGGTTRMGLPCYEESEKLLKAAKVKSCVLGAEIYMQAEYTRGLRIHQVVSVLRNPKSEADMERLGLAVFDVIEHDGEPVETLKEVFSLLDKWFDKGKLVHVVEHVQTKKTEDLLRLFADWVIDQGAEGIVLQHDSANWYKVKPKHNLEVAIIGFSEDSGEDSKRKGMLHDLLVAVMRSDGTFHELTRVGGGFSDDERRSIAAELKKSIVPSDYVAVNNDYVAYEMIRPGPVIEMSCLDLITESSRGGPINRMVLKWDGKRYTALSRMPLVSVISPQFVRIRDDKTADVEDVNISQLTDITNVVATEKPAEDPKGKPSTLLERAVYTKEMKGNLMVRKLVLWKTNKEDKPEFPAYVIYLTDFSPNRQEPLQRDIRIASTEAVARKHYERMAEANFIGGWEKASK